MTEENYTEGIGSAGQYYCGCFISIKIDFTKNLPISLNVNLNDTASGSAIEITEGKYKDVLLYGFSGKITMTRVHVTRQLHVEMLSGLVNIINMQMPTNGNGNYNITLDDGNVYFSTTNNFFDVTTESRAPRS